MHSQSLNGSWNFRKLDTPEWLPASVPGGVHTDLLALGRIPDPFVADNEKKVQWVAESDWEYRLEFEPSAELLGQARQFLVCDGLDTLAEVSLNGQLLGKADNMYRQWRWELTGALKRDANLLSIVFRAPLNFIRERQALRPLIGGGDILGGPYLRKAPCQWGWDWGPKLPPLGVWKDIRLEGYSTARLEDVHLRQVHGAGSVTVSARVAVEYWQPADLQVDLEISAPDGGSQSVQLALAGQAAADLQCEIENPQLWCPNGYGTQPLYRVRVTLRSGPSVLDACEYQLGLHTIQLRREPDEWGESFGFVVNGVPVFAKGADWIPADAFPTRTSDAQLEFLIKSAADAHMNMLRVWGGGVYETERFYDLCDRYGILIWQDFIFACGIYPEDEAFAANVRAEAVQNVRRLRHRASLALWCGNNEMEQGWTDWGWNKPADASNQSLKAGYDRMFHHLLPEVVAAEDPDHAYWPSSASSGIPFAQPNGDQRGDMHYWEVWHGRKPFTAYRSQFPRFMSEFGFQALPTYKTVQAYAAPADQNMTSYVMEHHQRSGSGNGLMIAQMTDTFRMPKDFVALVYLSMLLQAEGIRYGVEHWRRNMKRVSGTLIWQLNDCWPVASWASLDYFGRWKALHYAARRFYAPLLLSVEDDGTRMSVHVSSDLAQPCNVSVHWRLESLGGERLDGGELALLAASLADTPVTVLDFAARVTDDNRRSTVFVCELWQDGQMQVRSVSGFVPIKHLELSDPGLRAEVSLVGGALQIELSAGALARFIELELDGADVVFSDNYFDLPAGCSVRITAELPAGWNLARARKALRLRSLIDSYQ